MLRWTVLLGCFVGMGVSISATLAFPFGLYLDALTREFGWSRTQFAATLSFISAGNLVMLPMAGYAVDRIGAVRSMLIGFVLANAFCAGLALTRSYVGFVTISCLASMSGALALYPAFFSIVRGWFDRNLGLALAIASAGVSVGVAAFARIITTTIARHGWRNAFITSAAIAFVAGALSILILVRENKGALPCAERRPQREEDAAVGVSLAVAVRSIDFWLFAIAFLLVVFAGSGPQVHLPALLTDRGASPDMIASVVGAMALGSVAGRIATGLLLDRVSFRLVAAIFFIGQAVGIFTLYWNIHLAVPAALLMGSALGAEVDLMGFVMARRFGRRAYARILGVALAIAQSALLIGPVGTGLIYDHFKSYNLVLATYPALSVLAVVLMMFARTSRSGKPAESREPTLPKKGSA